MSAKLHSGWICGVQLLQPAEAGVEMSSPSPLLMTAANDANVSLWDISKSGGPDCTPFKVLGTSSLHDGEPCLLRFPSLPVHLPATRRRQNLGWVRRREGLTENIPPGFRRDLLAAVQRTLCSDRVEGLDGSGQHSSEPGRSPKALNSDGLQATPTPVLWGRIGLFPGARPEV
jgi:hypothetical protein